jgi:hypothetical protein
MATPLRSKVITALTLFWLVGCGGPSIKTHPVSGKVEIKDGDAAVLTGSTIELKHQSDESLRPYGNFDSAGNFTVKTVHQGEVLEGAPEGQYSARIVLADESDEGVPKRKGEVIHRRFLNFETSGLSVTVPSDQVTVTLSRK